MNDFYKVLSDETRLRCLVLIFENRELCVCELIHALELPQSKISRHLSIIKLNGLIKQRREGQWVLYSIHPQLSDVKRHIISLSIDALKDNQPYKKDSIRLHNMSHRPAITEGVMDV